MKSEIVAKYMRMAYDDIKKTLECQSYANKWGDIYKNKNIDDVMFRDYLIEKVNEKPALESVCKYLCIEYTFYWLNIWNCTLWLFRWL